MLTLWVFNPATSSWEPEFELRGGDPRTLADSAMLIAAAMAADGIVVEWMGW